MLIVLFLQVASLGVLFIIIYLLARPIIGGAIYFPTTSANTKIIISFAALAPGQLVVDIGSGDGKLLVAFAEIGIEAHGYEINPILVWQSRRTIAKKKLSHLAFVHWKSFWRVNMGAYDVIIVYGIPYIMKRLGAKLKKELKPGTKVLSNIYQFPGWTVEKEERGVRLYRA